MSFFTRIVNVSHSNVANLRVRMVAHKKKEEYTTVGKTL